MAGIHPSRDAAMLTMQAPAKINLTLEVLGKRKDGYHEIRTVMQTINLCDTLRLQLSHNGIEFDSDAADWSPEKSLISKAANLLQEATGCSKGTIIEIDKRIPLMSGLGGDSSAAAAVLRGLNKLWKLRLSQKRLLELAAQLGSDVGFFLYGGTALATGRGEIVTPLPPLPTMWVVLVVPAVPRLPGKTGRLYASLEPAHFTDGRITEEFCEKLKESKELSPSLLFNTFENIAFARASELNIYREHILKCGAPDVHLAGSGPTMFSMLKDKARADDLYVRLKQQGMETYLANTLTATESAE